MDDSGLDIDVDREGSTCTVRLRGELDLVSMPKFQAEIRELLTDTPVGTTVLLDAADLTYIDSVGVGQLVAAWELVRADGHAMGIVRPHPFTRRILELTGLAFLIVGPVDGVAADEDATAPDPT
jgi:anti-anti-sigma factor